MKRKVIKYNLITMILIGSCAANATSYSGVNTLNYPADIVTSGSDTINSGAQFNITAAPAGVVNPLGTTNKGIFVLDGAANTMLIQGGSDINLVSNQGGLYANAPTGLSLFSLNNGTNLTLDSTAGSGGSITMDITANGPTGIFNTKNGSSLNANGLVVNLSRTSDMAKGEVISADTNTTINLNNSIFNVSGTATGYFMNIGGAGTKAFINNTNIQTSGTHVIMVSGKNTVDINNSQILTSASSAYSLFADGGATISGENNTITSLGVGSKGAYATANSTIELTNSNIATQQASGAHATGSKASITLHGGSILTGVRMGTDISNPTTYGKPVDASGNLVTDPTKYIAVASSGVAGIGVLADSKAGIIINPNASDSKMLVHTLFQDGTGLNATTQSSIAGDNIDVITNGIAAMGVYASQASKITLTNTNVTTTGNFNTNNKTSADAVSTSSGSQVSITHGIINTSGSGAMGLVSNDRISGGQGGAGNTFINANDINLTTQGASAYGAYALTGGIINIANGQLATNGAGSAGLWAKSKGIVNVIDTTSVSSITTSGNNGTGVIVDTGGTVNITGLSDSQRIQVVTNGNTDKTLNNTPEAGAAGVAAWYNGTVNLNNVDITTNGGPKKSGTGTSADDFGANGIWARAVSSAGATPVAGESAVITAKNVSVTTHNGHGIEAENGASILLNDIDVISNNGAGIFAEKRSSANSSTINAIDMTITTTNGPAAVYSHDGGYISLTGNNQITGNNTHGLRVGAESNDSLIDSLNANVSVSGDNSIAAFAESSHSGAAVINLTGHTQLQSSGISGMGIRAAQAGALINMTDGEINTTGQSGVGAEALTGGVVNLAGTLVTSSGDAGVALSAAGIAASGNSTLSATNVIAQATHANGNGAQVYGSGVLNLNNSEVTGQQHGIILSYNNNMPAFSDGGQNSVTIDGGKLVSVTGDAFHFDDGLNSATTQLDADILVKNGAQITAGSGNLLNALSNNANMINFTVDNIALDGDIISAGAGSSVTNVNLQNGTTLIGKMAQSGAAAINVDAQANTQWTYTASSDINNLTNSGSIISNTFSGNNQSQSDYKLLTVNGNYTGNNGLLVLNTYMGNDSAPSDRLVVNGDTRGDTRLKIINTRTLGDGDPTIANGIEVISVGGNSNGNFALEGGAVSKGAYDYFLHKGGVAQDAGNGNWYLRNTNQPDPVVPVEPVDPAGPVTPVTPRGANTPIVNPATGNYIANAYADNWMFMHTLHDRLGEPQYTDKVKGEIEKPTSMWLRIVGSHAGSRAADSQLKLTTNTYMVQGGGDVAQWSSDGDDRYHLGMMMGYGNAHNTSRSTLSGLDTKGTTDGYSAGLYATWYQNDNNPNREGMYVDSWVQYGWFNNTVTNSRNAGRSDDNYNSDGISASLETGYAFKLHENANKESLFIEPQAQIVWAGVTADDHTDGTGTRISQQDNGAWISRLGARLYGNGHHKMDDGKDRTFQPFVEANWIHNSSDYSYKFDDVSIKQDGTKNIAELKLGVEGQLNKEWTVWTHVGQQLGDKGFHRTDALVGVKYMF